MSASVLLDSGVSHNSHNIAVPQFTKFSKSVKKCLLWSVEPMEVHLANNSLVITHQIMYLLLQFADNTIYTVEFWVVPALNYAIILGMPFPHTLSPTIDGKTHSIVWQRP